ncbi:NUDIX hydrolase [Plesiocystis pacifica SIR-1]|uniref:8-oxo-dGTP diphosphatase n=1 Tax=Plesiocystis pacifica SIR-1 TaxID=391625 RepID=A6GIG5_9BACT|nr:NUDIX domain-containing protein [Plesiocystis pacifica]EDM74328.1 NUDIX hydrolase [Plesiocystis pacifica SIR-1]
MAQGERSPERPQASDAGSPRLVVAAALVWLDLDPATLLVQRRAPEARHGAGKLELPGGKLERGEAPRAALERELVEEWGPAAAQLGVGPVAEVLHHCYPPPGPEVILIVFHVDGRAWSGPRWRARAVVEAGVEIAAFPAASLPLDDFLAADRPFLAAIAAGEVRPPRAWSAGGGGS